MMMKKKFINPFVIFSVILLFMDHSRVVAQDDNPDPDEDLTVNLSGVEGFHFGFFLGAYFPNNSTASIYDGYGIDLNGEKNSFTNSYMYRKIVLENSGLNGQPDRIAEQLEIQPGPGAWTFDESNMPENLKYKPAFLLGIHLNYGISKKGSVLLNLNFARVTATGVFTIITPKPPGANQFYQTIHTFALRGSEQRSMFQLGYNHIFGNHKYVNFFAEAGMCVNYAKMLKNFIQINALTLDLTTFNNQGGYNYYEPKEYTGWGLGVFGGLGLYLRLNSKFTAKVLYNPSYEKINIGLNPSTNLQHTAGLRIYYRI